MASLALVICIVASPICFAQHMNAEDAPCQGLSIMDWKACIGAAYERADAELNQYYRRIETLETGTDLTNLKDAQRLWIQFRDANCEAEYELYQGGSAAPTVKIACLEAMTRHRTEELKTMYGWRLEKFSK
ncbi:MAG: lysozyme inhibitor LprI family protein [Terracidiphilus sp.]